MDATTAPPKRSNVRFLIPVAVLGAGAALFFGLRGAAKSEVVGSISVGGETWQPDRCQSGKLGETPPAGRTRFDGVDLYSAAAPQRRVRVLEDPTEGKVVALRDGGPKPTVLDPSQCSTYSVELTDTGTLIMETWGIEGSIELDCPELQASVQFSSCYNGD
jgi:hypothetical protein